MKQSWSLSTPLRGVVPFLALCAEQPARPAQPLPSPLGAERRERAWHRGAGATRGWVLPCNIGDRMAAFMEIAMDAIDADDSVSRSEINRQTD